MAWWNRKQTARRSNPHPKSHAWENAQGQLGGMPAFLRINATLAAGPPYPGFDSEASVVIHFNSPGEDGLPKMKAELESADEVEAFVKDHLESTETAVLALVLTGRGVRTMVFYCSDTQAAIKAWEQEIAPRMTTHQVEFRVRPDPAWERLREFAEACRLTSRCE